MKMAEIMDGSTKPKLPSIKTAEIMDGNTKMKLPSMKSGKIMDGSFILDEPDYLRPLEAIMSVSVALNSVAPASCSTVRCMR